jgi:uncharacterized protein
VDSLDDDKLAQDVARLTQERGGSWGIDHTRRLLELVSLLGAGESYDSEVVWLSAHMHDWGAYQPWAEGVVDHVQRSVEVAGRFLDEEGCPNDVRDRVLDCIAAHHSSNPGSALSIEAALLHDADALDFLGTVGIMRDASRNTRDLRKAYEAARRRRETLPPTLILEKSRKLAEQRLSDMDQFLAAFEADSFGWF